MTEGGAVLLLATWYLAFPVPAGTGYSCFTACAIAAWIFSRSSSLCSADTAVRMRSLPGGTAGATAGKRRAVRLMPVPRSRRPRAQAPSGYRSGAVIQS